MDYLPETSNLGLSQGSTLSNVTQWVSRDYVDIVSRVNWLIGGGVRNYDISSCATLTLSPDQYELYTVSELTQNIIIKSEGSPFQGKKMIIRVTDDGVARSFDWSATFRAMHVALPAVTIATKTLYMGFIYNATDGFYDLVAYSQEA